MNMVKKIALTASIALAVALTFSCSSDDEKEQNYKWCVYRVAPHIICTELSEYKTSTTMTLSDCEEGASIGYKKEVDLPADCITCVGPSCPGSSSSGGVGSGGSSSSGVGDGESSSSELGTYAGPYGSLPYEGQTYKTVVIGTQTWMVENLNYEVGDSRCYDDDPENCEIYGRLYDWATAMDLPASCNSSECEDQIQLKHRGICPEGWHIPSSSEWITLKQFTTGYAAYLYATSWGGLDTYGFTALPGGYYTSEFNLIGSYGVWWSSTENENIERSARSWVFNQEEYILSFIFDSKNNLNSIRCVED